MFDWLWSSLAARKMKLRDRGEMPEYKERNEGGYNEYKTEVCSFCKTRARVGIIELKRVLYCWRCEVVLHERTAHLKEPKEPGKLLIFK